MHFRLMILPWSFHEEQLVYNVSDISVLRYSFLSCVVVAIKSVTINVVISAVVLLLIMFAACSSVCSRLISTSDVAVGSV